MQGVLGYNVNIVSKEFLQVGNQTSRKKRTVLRLHIDQQVYVAFGIVFATSKGAKHAHICCSMTRRHTENLLAFTQYKTR